MPVTRTRRWTIAALAVLVTLSGAAFALTGLRPAPGYRAALAAWIAPQSASVGIPELQRRKTDFIINYFGYTYRGNTANYIDAHVYLYGAFERSEMYFVRDTLAALPGDPVLIDVGANTGLYSAFASKYAGAVHAFDPFPPVLERLRTLVEENGIANVVIHPVGLGASAELQPFFSPPDGNLGTGSFLPGFKAFQPGNRDEKLMLRIVTGDEYFPTAGIAQVDFVKIDIEGYEKAAMAGLRETLRRHRPVVVMETSVDPSVEGLFRGMDDLRAAFPEDYELFQIDDVSEITGAYQVSPIRSSFDRQDQFNLVAWPLEKAALVPRSSPGDAVSP